MQRWRDMSVKTYDAKCYELAAEFLGDEPHLHTTDNTEQLAKLIQQTIEEFIADMNRDYDPPDRGDAWSGGFAENH
jgi:hypothetical protein